LGSFYNFQKGRKFIVLESREDFDEFEEMLEEG